MRRFTAVGLMLLGMVPGDAVAQTPVIPTRRVEGGVAILQHKADAFRVAPQTTIEASPLWTIGGADGDADYNLEYVREILILSDGRIAAFASISNTLQIYTSKGRPERLIGKQGKGPGDFIRTTGLILLPGDTLYTLDIANRRGNWITPSGGVVRMASMPAPTGPDMLLSTVGVLPSGQVVWWGPAFTERPTRIGTRARPKLPVVASGLLQENLRVVDSIPGFETEVIRTAFRGRQQPMEVPITFWTAPSLAVWDTAIAIANVGHGYSIERRAANGGVLARITVPVQRTVVTQAMREAVIVRSLERYSGTRGERLVDPEESRRQAREQPFSDSLPAIQNIIVGADGTLWAVDGLADGLSTSWAATQYRADGAIVSRLIVQGKGTPIYFHKGRVVVRHVDEDGVVSLTMHRIVPAPRK